MPDGSVTMDQTFVPDAANPRPFRDALGRFATGVAVITTEAPTGPMGFTANSFASLSMDPPLVLWSPARSSQRFPVYAAAETFAIHILAETQMDWATRFVRGGAGFDGLTMARNDEGVPVLPGALARFDCTRHAEFDGGDHLIIVGRVLRCAVTDGTPLVFARGRYGTIPPG
jgi:flavin reductase (DIM6/NTAB) family NADH-FMN oxidoreductase RutF